MNNISFSEKIKKQMRRFPNLFVLLFFSALTLIIAFPVVSQINSVVPKGGGDTYQALANIGSTADILQANGFLSGLRALAQSFRFNIFLPYGLLSVFVGKFAAYNVLFLLSFILSGWGAYLLAHYFTKNRFAAILAGIIFAFSPFHYYQSVAVHIGTMHQEWLPFLALFLFRFFEKFEFKYFLGVVSFAFLIALTEHQLLAFSVIFIGILVIYKLFTEREILKNKKFWAYVGCSLALFAAAVFFLFMPLLRIATSENNFLDAGQGAAEKYSIKILDPIAVPAFHSLWPKIGELVQKVILGGTQRGSYFIGYLVLVVLVCYFWRIRKKKSEVFGDDILQKKNIKFWMIGTAILYVFSLGPSFNIGKFSIWLPYYLIYRFVPFFENIRTTGRLFVWVMLGVAILFAYGFDFFVRKYSLRKTVVTVMAGVIILLEFAFFPVQTMTVRYSSFYDRIGQDKGAYKLLEIPGSTSYEFASYAMMTNNIHKKKVVNGMPLARKISGQFKWQRNTPVVKQLLYTLPKGNDPEKKVENPATYFAEANLTLNQANIGYITISKAYVKEKVLLNAEKFIEKYIRYDNKYEDEFLVAYKITDVSGK